MELLLVLLAGSSVVASTHVARRWGGRWGGILAAAPVTPTFSILAMRASPAVLLQAMPIVALTALVCVLASGRRPVWMAAVLPLGGFSWTLLLLAAALVGPVPVGSRPAVRPLPWPGRFAVGSGTVMLVAWAAQAAPAFAPWLAMMPWLFVAGTLAAAFESGGAGARSMLSGGMAGVVGVGAFLWAAWAAAPLGTGPALVGGWFAFAAAAWASSWRPGLLPRPGSAVMAP